MKIPILKLFGGNVVVTYGVNNTLDVPKKNSKQFQVVSFTVFFIFDKLFINMVIRYIKSIVLTFQVLIKIELWILIKLINAKV